MVDNIPFHLSMRDLDTIRCLQVGLTQCFFEVMAHLWVCGGNVYGECTVRPLHCGKHYVGALQFSEHLVLPADLSREDDVVSLLCSTLSGYEMLCLTAQRSEMAWDIHKAALPMNCGSPKSSSGPDGQWENA